MPWTWACRASCSPHCCASGDSTGRTSSLTISAGRSPSAPGSSTERGCLVNAVAVRPWGSPFFTLVREHAAVFAQLPPAIHRGAVEAYVRGASHRGLGEDDLAMLLGPWTDAEGQAAFYRQIAQADEAYTDEVEPRYGEITEPTHIVWGAEDTWVPPDRAEQLHCRIPHSTLTLIEGAGHLLQLDAPDRLTTELRARTTRAAVAPTTA